MIGMLIGTLAVVTLALVLAVYGLTQAAVVVGVAAILTTFAIATVSLRRWATCEHRTAAQEEAGHANGAVAPNDRSRRAA
jgi:hypothetical protein